MLGLDPPSTVPLTAPVPITNRYGPFQPARPTWPNWGPSNPLRSEGNERGMEAKAPYFSVATSIIVFSDIPNTGTITKNHKK